MNAKTVLEYQWPYLLSFLPSAGLLDETALAFGAIRRKRAVEGASSLLRLILAYGFCGLSLRQTAAWAEVLGVASLSNVALLKRFRQAAPWLGHLLAVKLAERAAPPPLSHKRPLLLRLIDATSISHPGSNGTDWRVHLSFNLERLAIGDIDLTDRSGGEKLSRFRFAPGDLVLADRGYSHRRDLYAVHHSGAHLIVRQNWQNLPLQHLAGEPFDVFSVLRSLPEAEAKSVDARTRPDRRFGLPAIPVRFVALRKTEAAAEASRKKLLADSSRKGHRVDPRALEAAGYIFVITNTSAEQLTAEEVLELYRFRWQIELAFKRMKGMLELGFLPAKDPALARTIIRSKLLAALLLEEFTQGFLAISPWGYPLGEPSALAVEDPARDL